MEFTTNPLVPVTASLVTYSALLSAAIRLGGSPEHAELSTKALSALHATSMTAVGFYNLKFSSWELANTDTNVSEPGVRREKSRPTGLNDDGNPIIFGTSSLGNALTSWETGYLIYDTAAMIYAASKVPGTKSTSAAIVRVVKRSPVFLAHHAVLIATFSYLQVYIARGAERGVWVIVAFLVMYASNPFLHLRWWIKQRQGRRSALADLALILVFAISRFCNVAWVLKRYGKYHGLSALEAYKQLRLPCQIGTGALVGVNGLWWIGLVRNFLVRISVRKAKLP